MTYNFTIEDEQDILKELNDKTGLPTEEILTKAISLYYAIVTKKILIYDKDGKEMTLTNLKGE